MAEVPLKDLQTWACEWEDAHGSSLEYERSEITHRPMKYVTQGILLKDDEVGMTFCRDVCETGTFRGTDFVPIKMIVRKWKIGPLAPKQKRPRTLKPTPETTKGPT